MAARVWLVVIILCVPYVVPLHFSNDCDENSDWNFRAVGKHVKEWLNSFRIGPNETSKFDSISIFEHGQVEFVGKIDAEGFADGPFWVAGGYDLQSNFSNGYFYGDLDQNGQLSGNDIIFLYPDMKTALWGIFINGTMISAKEATIVAQRCFDGVKRLRFSPSPNDEDFHFGRPNHLRFNFNPTQTDPYERKRVNVKETNDRGQGLFTKTRIEPGDVVAYYAGLIFDSKTHEMFSPNMTQSQVDEVHRMLIVLEGDLEMNLPRPYWELAQYRATLGHKVNHSFHQTNAEFIMSYHPRFGWIRALRATKRVSRGQEILVDYGYPIDDEQSPAWYLEAYHRYQDSCAKS